MAEVWRDFLQTYITVVNPRFLKRFNHSPLLFGFKNHGNLTFSHRTPSSFHLLRSFRLKIPHRPGPKGTRANHNFAESATSKWLAHHGRWWKGEGTCQNTQIEEEFEAQNQAASASLCQGCDFGSLQLKEDPTKLVGLKEVLFCCCKVSIFFVMFFFGC